MACLIDGCGGCYCHLNPPCAHCADNHGEEGDGEPDYDAQAKDEAL